MKYRKKRIPALAWVIFFSICIGFNIDAQSRGLDVVAKSLGGDDFQIGKQYAVLIAVDRYKEWTSLRAPVADAKAIKTILESRYYIDEIVELYDEEASASGIRQLFGKLIDTVQSDDSVLIYYAGHGFTDRFNTGFWIPSEWRQGCPKPRPMDTQSADTQFHLTNEGEIGGNVRRRMFFRRLA